MTSLLESIAAVRDQVAGAQHKTITVPRWEEHGLTVRVTYKLASDKEIDKLINGQKRKDREARRKASLQFHVDTATGIEFSDGKETETFDGFGNPDLSEVLAVEVPSAQANVERLFIGDGDMASVGRAVLEWSGYSDQSLDDEALGE